MTCWVLLLAVLLGVNLLLTGMNVLQDVTNWPGAVLTSFASMVLVLAINRVLS